MAEKKRILFVCMGNIIRSPLAEALFRRQAAALGVEDHYSIDSAGTDDWHVGEGPDPRMLRIAARQGFSYNHRARQFEDHDFERFDLIVAMDRQNFEELLAMVRSPEQEARLHLLREWDPYSGPRQSVPDPYYGGVRGFDEVYAVIERSVVGLVSALEQNRRP